MGIKAVAVHSEADREALHVRMADEAWPLGGNDLSSTYLDIEKIVGIAVKAGCQAIHPGYGFLSENSLFVSACDAAGIVFIGPNARAMKLMGNKIESREALRNAAIPMTAGITGNMKALLKRAGEVPLPLLVKAAAGGGGKGMRIVHDLAQLPEVLESTTREAKAYFGDGTVYIEQYIEEPRHIEIQVLGDKHGNVVHLFERECSIQRRYQKIIEESPSPTLNQEIRELMGATAVRIAREIGYDNAGTVEFLVDKNLNFYFLEMNTRVQVEHPVTEMVTGFDIVKEQILIASGERLSISQEKVHQNGHAIECRIYAEDPENNFLPSPGAMCFYHEPSGEGIRLDSGIDHATVIHSFYDPLISKLIAWGSDRNQAREKMKRALENLIIHGIRTNIAFLRQIIGHPEFIRNMISTKYCDDHAAALCEAVQSEKNLVAQHIPLVAYILADFRQSHGAVAEKPYNAWQEVGYWRDVMEPAMELDGNKQVLEIVKVLNGGIQFRFSGIEGSAYMTELSGGSTELVIDESRFPFHASTCPDGIGHVTLSGLQFQVRRNDRLMSSEEAIGSMGSEGLKNDGNIVSPMPGKVIKVNVIEGDKVKKGATLLIVEAMKMENHISAPSDGIVEKINVKPGDMVNGSVKLIHLKAT
jgi:acetyl/propionyl-CoA carboxylase alpha subunit